MLVAVGRHVAPMITSLISRVLLVPSMIFWMPKRLVHGERGAEESDRVARPRGLPTKG